MAKEALINSLNLSLHPRGVNEHPRGTCDLQVINEAKQSKASAIGTLQIASSLRSSFTPSGCNDGLRWVNQSALYGHAGPLDKKVDILTTLG